MRFFQFSSREKERILGASRGFSLLETLLAIFIFGLVMTSVTVYFANITKANRNSKLLQQNLEDTQFAMNRIAKVLRTSAVVDPPPNGTTIQPESTIRVHDFSQGRCIEYQFSGTEIIERRASGTAPPSDNVLTWCKGLVSTDFSTDQELVSISNGTLSGIFAVVPSDDPPTAIAGRVTMNVTITRGNLSSTAQTSVSLRNYKELAP